jgi:hypothetical protein
MNRYPLPVTVRMKVGPRDRPERGPDLPDGDIDAVVGVVKTP